MQPAHVPPPTDLDVPVRELILELAGHLGVPAFVAECTALMGGAPRSAHQPALRYLAGRSFDAEGEWDPYWWRTWGARGLLHVWDDSATGSVVAGLADEHWRPAEMCLKVSTRHEVAGSAEGAAALVVHELPRVRAQALRTLAVTGDSEHLDLVRQRIDDPDEAVRRQARRALDRLGRRLDLDPEGWT